MSGQNSVGGIIIPLEMVSFGANYWDLYYVAYIQSKTDRSYKIT